jgi:hypothetical protein
MDLVLLYILSVCLAVLAVLIGLVWWQRVWLVSLDMLDWLHWASFVVGAGQLGFILYYYIPLMQWRADGGGGDGHRDTFISDFLFSDAVYRSVMTGFVALQLCICVLFVTRLRSRHDDGPILFCVEVSLFVCAWVGWTTLCAQYTTGHSMSKVHAVGVGLFIASSLLYVLMMSYNVFLLFAKFNYIAAVEFILLALFLFTSIVLGCHFIYKALEGEPSAWVTEHLAFVFFVACHMLLFFIDYGRDRVRGGVLQTGGPFAAPFNGLRIQLV